MELKKCNRCGCFFSSANDVCCNCFSKDKIEISKLNNYIEESFDTLPSIEDMSINTGIPERNIKRFANNNLLEHFNYKF